MKNSEEIASAVFQARDEYIEQQQRRTGRIRKTAAISGIACALCMTVGGIGYFESIRYQLPTAPTDAKTEHLPEGTFLKCPKDEQPEVSAASTQPRTETAPAAVTETICTQIHLPCQTVEITTQDAPPETMPAEELTMTQAETQPPSSISSEMRTTEEWAEEPKWDDRTIAEQFLEFTVDGNTYVSRVTKIGTAKLGEKICDAQISGYDFYTDTTHHADVQVYRIAGIAEECAVTVRFPDIDEGYVYTSRDYFPETLGDLMDALSLRETISFHTLCPAQGGTETTEYDRGLLMDLLNGHREVPRIEDDSYHKPLFSVSTNVDVLGITNKSLKITKDGYLTTNIMESGYVFFIGEEAAAEIAQAFGIEAADTPIPTGTGAVIRTTPANAVITEEIMMES